MRATDRGILLVLAFLAAAWAAWPGSVSAQQLGAQRFVPASSEDGVLGTEGAERRYPRFPYVSLWATYALNPVVVEDENGDEVGAPVEHLVGLHFVFDMQVWEGLELGVAAPLSLLQAGDEDLAAQVGLDPPGLAIGDVEVRAAYRFMFSPTTFLAVHVPVLLPTAPEEDVASLGFGVRPTLAFTQGFEQVDLVLNASYLVRGEENAADYDGGDELGLRAAVRIGLDAQWDTAVLGEVGLATQAADFFSAAGTPAEGRLGLEHWFADHWRLTGFVGTGLSTGVGAPDFRGGLGLSFGKQPRRPRMEPGPDDWDGDGIPDDQDACPHDPEDRDGFEDADGCPDEDNDSDGILDVDDACPNEPESDDGIADDDGCPDRVRVEGTLITTFEPVQFRTNSAEIKRESYPMLNEIAGVMRANPDMEVRVEGHTDTTGPDDYNEELSEQRAASVRDYLIGRGIDADRLEAEGLGESRPVASDDTEAGRRQNRRVEFHIEE